MTGIPAKRKGKMMKMKALFIGLCTTLMLPVFAAPNITRMTIDHEHIKQWNGFTDSLVQLHERNLQGRRIRTEQDSGGYAGQPDFYREVRYYDADRGLLLSRLQWEQEQPERLHMIEVFVHDEHGRVVRDYLSAYLPQHRNAPIQTLINLHGYGDRAHGYRQFDASGNRIYEYCRAKSADDVVEIHLEQDQILRAERYSHKVINSAAYQACFDDVQKVAGSYVRNPR